GRVGPGPKRLAFLGEPPSREGCPAVNGPTARWSEIKNWYSLARSRHDDETALAGLAGERGLRHGPHRNQDRRWHGRRRQRRGRQRNRRRGHRRFWNGRRGRRRRRHGRRGRWWGRNRRRGR